MISRFLARWMGVCILIALGFATPAEARKEIVVDYEAGLVYPLENGRLVRGPIITNHGVVFKKKYLGTFRVSEKAVEKRSNLYNRHGNPIRNGEEGARMQYWMRLGNTAQGFHYSSLFTANGSRRRSRGCYRLSKADAVWLFGWTPMGTPVQVVWSVRQSRFAYLGKAAPSRKASLTAEPGGAAVRPEFPMRTAAHGGVPPGLPARRRTQSG